MALRPIINELHSTLQGELCKVIKIGHHKVVNNQTSWIFVVLFRDGKTICLKDITSKHYSYSELKKGKVLRIFRGYRTAYRFAEETNVFEIINFRKTVEKTP